MKKALLLLSLLVGTPASAGSGAAHVMALAQSTPVAQPSPGVSVSVSKGTPVTTTMSVLAPKAPVVDAKVSGHVVLTKDNTLSLNDVFYGESVSPIIKLAKEMDSRLPSGDPIYLFLNSPGGEIDSGLELIEDLSQLHRPVHTVIAFAASMGFQTTQGLGDRLILSNGTLMSHRARGGFYGEFPGQLDTRYAFYLKRVTRMDQKAVARSGGKYTLDSYHSLIQNEFWCDGQDCVDAGFADKVVTASCDKSIEGTHWVTLDRFVFFGHGIELKAEYDNCPLNTNDLNMKIYIDGEPLFKEAKPDVKPATDTTGLTGQQHTVGLYSSLWDYSSSRSSSFDTSTLTKDEINEITKKVDAFMEDKRKRQVHYGY